MIVRTRVFAAAGAVALIAAGTAAVVLGVLREGPAERARPVFTQALAALETTALPGFGADSGTGTGAFAAAPVRPLTETPRRAFSVNAALAHVRALEAFGVRAGGSEAERQAALYLRDQLAAIGLEPRIEEFGLPNGATSRNVVARVEGRSDIVLVLGAHMDTKPPSPGANDNASGCGALLELAAILASDPVAPTVEIVFFGSEEVIGGDPDAHHFGSRYRVSQMSAADRANTAGMISIDMIGYGSGFHSRSAGKAPLTVSDGLLAEAGVLGFGMTFKKDTSSYGLSDHEAYEAAGIPAAVVCWRTDPVYHTAGDTSGHLVASKIAAAGTVVLEYARGLDEAGLGRLVRR